MILSSSNCIAYTGAGISTSAGISDYASRSAGSKSQVHQLLNGTLEQPNSSTTTNKPQSIPSSISKMSTASTRGGVGSKYVSPIVAAYSAVDSIPTPPKSKPSTTTTIATTTVTAATTAAPKPKNSLAARPTFAHHVLTRLYEVGLLKWWCQQNHDGLPQKAGYPQHAINEIHGSWFDPSNRVVKFDESLREDLCEDMYQWQERADLVIAVGTSLSGMAADEIVSVVSSNAIKRYRNHQRNQTSTEGYQCGGSVIIGFQRTSHDHEAALRIYCSIERVFDLLVNVLVDMCSNRDTSSTFIPDEAIATRVIDIFSRPIIDDKQLWSRQLQPVGKEFPDTGSKVKAMNVYEIMGYDPRTGKKQSNISTMTTLDLRPGKRVKITTGVEEGCFGVVDGDSSGTTGNVSITWTVPVRSKDPKTGKTKKTMGTVTRSLGAWNIVSAMEGKLPILPVLNSN